METNEEERTKKEWLKPEIEIISKEDILAKSLSVVEHLPTTTIGSLS